MKMNNSPNDKMNIEEMKKAAKDGKIEQYMNENLSPDVIAKVQSVLNDEKTKEKLLSSPQAKELFKKLGGDK